MARSNPKTKSSSLCFFDGCIFLGGVAAVIFLVWGFWSFKAPFPSKNPNFLFNGSLIFCPTNQTNGPDLLHDPPEKSFYDDPEMGYTLDKPMKNWDQKRKDWLSHHPSFIPGAENRILMLTGSQPFQCQNPIGDHLMLRFFKNKADYCRIHGYNIFYNNLLLHPKMEHYWNKYPVLKAAMMAHPEVEWMWWVDSDAVFTDMDFKIPLDRYKDYNLVVHGWHRLIHEEKKSMGLNAGVFLIRNCQWSLDLMDEWANMGPQSPDYKKWGEIQSNIFKDKGYPNSDDQAGLAYLIMDEEKKWGEKIYLVNEYELSGYWVSFMGKYENLTERNNEMERGEEGLRRRHGEMVSEGYGEMRVKKMEEKYRNVIEDKRDWRRPFITHFTGCQPCNGNYNKNYGSGENCWNAMKTALNFADNQLLRNYGFVHQDLLDNAVSPIPFDYPGMTSS